eukprot:gene12206-18856_t
MAGAETEREMKGTPLPEAESPHDDSVDTFEDAGLHPSLLRGIFAHGRVIVPFVNGRDLHAVGQAGTGKTAIFVIGILQRVDWAQSGEACQGLILSPTRERAMETVGVVTSIGKYLPRENFCGLIVGGRPLLDDLKTLKRGVVAVGTPGRSLQMMMRNALKTESIK